MKIACLGLSANPPHNAHLLVAREVLRLTDADEVWLIPCWQHSFAKDLISWSHRFAMTRLMERPRIKAHAVEFLLKGRGHTIETIRALKTMYPQHQFIWVVGADIVQNREYRNWKSWRKLAKEARFWIAEREGYVVPKNLPKCFERVISSYLLRVNGISSTLIREWIKAGIPITGLVTEEVEEYIQRHKLFKKEGE